jgi:hypothetical protein
VQCLLKQRFRRDSLPVRLFKRVQINENLNIAAEMSVLLIAFTIFLLHTGSHIHQKGMAPVKKGIINPGYACQP